MEQYDFVVLGGGVSGLGFAKRMSENGYSVLILEKEGVVGGLSRTLFKDGYYLDFCAHRFHTNNEELLDEILSLEGFTMKKHLKKSRVYMFNKYLRYPFEIQNLLRAMPLHQSFVCGVSFLLNQITKRFRKTNELRSYKDWFVHIYGKQLYKIMCSQYTLKFWHVDPALLSADWADQRFQAENMAKLVKRIIKKILTLDFSSYSIEDDSLAPDGGAFYYPLRGIQELPDALARESAKNGATILTAAEITAIDSNKKTVSFEISGATQTVTYGNIISTIPLHSLYRLQERRDETVEKALSEIKYMDIIFVYLFVDKPQISNDHWLYFPDKDIIFNRAVEFSNWSPLMCPEGKTSVCFDITTFGDNKEWQMTDEELAQRTIDDAVRIKYIKKDEVISSYVFRVKSAYPFYDLDYKTKLDIVVRFLEQNSTHLLGRTGIFKYNNSDNSIEMGFELANKFLKNERDLSIYQYRIKAISY